MKQSIQDLYYSAQKAHQNSDFQMAENLYKQVLNQEAKHSGALEYLGILYGQKNMLNEAAFYLYKAYESEPDNHIFCNNLAESYRRKGDTDEAISFFRKAIDIFPNSADYFCNLGIVLNDKGNIQEAIENFYLALKNNSKHFDSLQNLGNIMLNQKKYDNALEYFKRAQNKSPEHPYCYNNIAIVLNKLGNNEEAIENYKEAIRLNPQFIDAYNNLGNLFFEIENNKDAGDNFSSVLRIESNNVTALNGLANINISLGKYANALDIFEEIIKINPNIASVFNTIGSLFTKAFWNTLAIEKFKKAIEIDPDYEPALYNLAICFEREGNIDEARIYYNKLLKLQPDNELLKFHTELMSPFIFHDIHEIENARLKISHVLDSYIEKDLNFDIDKFNFFTSQSFFMMTYHGKDDREFKERYSKIFQKCIPENSPKLNTKGKKRIGFLVTNGHEKIFAKSLCGLLNNFSRNKYTYIVICNKLNCVKDIKPNISNPEIEFLDLPVNLKDAVKVIKSAQIDIINFFEIGTDAMNFFLPFFKLAPIQTYSWGWPSTSGNSRVDYYISGENLEISDGERFYTEKLIRFKNIPNYYYRPEIESEFLTRSHFNLSDSDNIYFCNQALVKIHPDFDIAINEILRKDPNGVIIFLKDRHNYTNYLMTERFKKNCSEVISRIIFFERMPFEKYLNLISVSDVIIDTFHYTGANTSYDAFALGKPVVTLPTNFFKGRFTYAEYMQMGITDCIAKNETDYIEKAVKLGTDKKYNMEISKKILEKCYLLFENMETVHEHEQFFDEAINKST